MQIKTLKLINFQKHSDLTLNFESGVNVLHGKSDSGKSCIRRAIEWCLFSESISGVRKEGSKQTSVTITFDNDIELERVRSQTINRYILRKDKEEKVYDAIGRSIPKEILDVINMQPITIDDEEINLNISRQLDPPFLLGKSYSGSFRMKLFNKLTGNDLLDKVLKSFSKDLRQINIDEKNYTEQLKEDKVKLESVEKDYDIKQKQYDVLNYKFKKLKKKQELLDKLKGLYHEFKIYTRDIEECKNELKLCKSIDENKLRELQKKLDRFCTLKEFNDYLISNKAEQKDISSKLGKIIAPGLNIEEMRGKIQRFNTLKLLQKRSKALDMDKKSETIELEQVTKDLKDKQIQYKEIVKTMDICKECNQIIGSGQKVKQEINK